MNPASRTRLYVLLLFLGAAILTLAGQQVHRSHKARLETATVIATDENRADGRGSIDLLSAAYHIDRFYQSMEGPSSNHSFAKLSPARGDEDILFVTGVRSEVVKDRTGEQVSPEFFCHANLTFNPKKTSLEKHNTGFAQPTHMDWRLVTLVPGLMEMRLPEGFGLPVKNGTQLDYFSMALNQNHGVPVQTVRFKTRVEYTSAAATRALFRRSVYVHQQFREKTAEQVKMDAAHAGAKCGESCDRNQRPADPSLAINLELPQHPGATCCVLNASKDGVVTQFGADSTVHWMVPPGKHSYKTDVTKQFELPYDTTAHYITGHLHPLGKFMRLIEKNTGRVIFEITSEDFKDKVGVSKMSVITSREGVPIRKGGNYELQADYDNTTDHEADVMAIMYLYLAESPDASVIVAGK